ncbi:Uncharacterised protein [Alistipes sp. cv1]|nr:Uncharacterised protein [Faecalibacterium prausnitzii]
MRTHPHENITRTIGFCIKELKFIQSFLQFDYLLFFVCRNLFCFIFFLTKYLIGLFFFRCTFAYSRTFHLASRTSRHPRRIATGSKQNNTYT